MTREERNHERRARWRGRRMPGRVAWRWRNVPIPEPLAIPLIAGMLFHAVAPISLLSGSWLRHGVGWPLLGAAVLLGGWAVRTVGQTDISNAPQLVTSGPYAHGRHPMYLAWIVGYLGITLMVNSLWPLMTLPPGLVATHLVVRSEERDLEKRFGEEFTAYAANVRRYL
jgi:protein-S-isoprenylcysteine O-methyltransferase Ste14